MSSKTSPRVIAKTLSKNDVGDTGSHMAGILIPKDDTILSFFPDLDSKTLNPRHAVTVRNRATGTSWTLNFVFYNNKLRTPDGTRNEYRLTRMTKLFRELSPIASGDIICFEKNSVGDIEVYVQSAAAAQKAKLTPLGMGRTPDGSWGIIWA